MASSYPSPEQIDAIIVFWRHVWRQKAAEHYICNHLPNFTIWAFIYVSLMKPHLMIIVRIIRTNGNLHLEYNSGEGCFVRASIFGSNATDQRLLPQLCSLIKPLQELLLMTAGLGLIDEWGHFRIIFLWNVWICFLFWFVALEPHLRFLGCLKFQFFFL